MRIYLVFVFLLLQKITTAQVDSFTIEKHALLPDSLQPLYQELSEKILADSADMDALMARADLVSGLNDVKYFFTIFRNEDIYQEALHDYTEAIKLSPYSHKAYFKRGLLKDRFLFYKEAIEDYEEAYIYAWGLENKIKSRVCRSRLKAQLGFYDIAIKDLEKALLEDV